MTQCDLAKVTEQTGGRPTKGTLANSVLGHDGGTHYSLVIAVVGEAKCWVSSPPAPPKISSSDLASNFWAVRNTKRDFKCSSPLFWWLFSQFSKFLQSMQHQKILQVKELTKGVESIVEVDWKHPEYVEYCGLWKRWQPLKRRSRIICLHLLPIITFVSSQ